MSQVRHIDAAGIDVLLQCMREAMKHDGDLKLASLSPQAAVVLELTRTGRLVRDLRELDAAVKSFSSFLPNAIKHFYPHPAHDGHAHGYARRRSSVTTSRTEPTGSMSSRIQTRSLYASRSAKRLA